MTDSRRRLRSLLASSPDPIFVTAVDGRVLDANQACLDLFRTDGDALEDLRATDFYADPADRERFRRTLSAEGSVTGWEVEMRRTDGTTFLARVDAAVRSDADGGAAGFTGFIKDITEEKRIQRDLLVAERRYRSLVDHNLYAVYVFDEKGRFIDGNAALEELLGRPVEKLLGHPFDDVIHPRDRAQAREVFSRALVGEATEYSLDVVRPDGRSLSVDGITVPILVGDETVGIQGVARDVTDHRRAQAELEERWESYRTLFDSVTVAIYIQDEEGRFLDVNAAALEMYGYARHEMIGQTPEMLACAGKVDLEATLERARKAMEGRPQRFEWWGRRKDGGCFPKDVTLSRGRYFGRDVVIAVARDVSEARRLEEQLRQAQKMEAVGRLAGGVAHDFNNVLTAIRGHADLALEEAAPDDPLRADLEAIRSSAHRAAHLISQLLAFSRRQVLRPEILDPAAVIADVRTMLARLIPARIELVFSLDDALWPVEVDRSQMEQVIVNLALNARDAMPRGGRLEVELSNLRLDEQAAGASHHDVEPGRWLRLTVRDDGSGMDEETLGRVFEPFFTTKEAGSGTGLGLATVYGIVKQSGGSIVAESTPGEGTTFDVLIPAAGGSGAEAGSGAIPRETRMGGATVLLCEDDHAVRSLARRALERHGYRVLEARQGEEALRVADSQHGPVDLLVTSLVLPGMGGRELTERLRRRHPDARALLVPGVGEGDPGSTVDGSPVPVLRKPFSPGELIQRVREVLE